VLVCALDELRVGWPVATVREIVRAVTITPLPTAPAVVEGVVDVRGTLVPVLDLRARFGLPSRELSPDEHLVLIAAGTRTVACRVSHATSIVDLPGGELRPPSGLAAGAQGVAGVAADEDGLVIVYDADAFLAESELIALGHALDAAASARDGHA
jgi:purine-binding chemotaxis protein CheW